jgi:hypothetical protein
MRHAREVFEGRRECPHCRQVSAERYTIQDALGGRLGSLLRRYACDCYGADVRGALLSETYEALPPECSGPSRAQAP